MDIEIHILEHLAKYTYLSKSQLNRLGIKVSDKSFYQALKRLREPRCAFIATRRFAPHPKFGALEDIHYLKPRGRKYLIEQHKRQPGHITIPLGSSRFYRDYQHRKTTIRCQLLLDRLFASQGWSILHYTNYFIGTRKTTGRGRESSTKIKMGSNFLRADSIIHVQQKNSDKHALFCLEVHNGYDVVKLVQQLKQYGLALAQGSPSNKLGVTIGCKLLLVFEHVSTLKTTVERVQDDPFFRYLKSSFLMLPFEVLHAQADYPRFDLQKQPISIHI